MIDFDALCLTPNINIFAVKVRFSPEATRPGTPPFEGRGVFSSGPVDIPTQDDGIFSDQRTTLGIRIGDFTHVPDRGDIVTILEGPYTGNKYWIDDQDEDGQGGIMFALRKYAP